MLQSGARNFELAERKRDERPMPEFLKRRIFYLPSGKWSEINGKVSAPFQGLVKLSPIHGKEALFVSRVVMFLESLCFAMERKTSAVTLFGVPQISTLEGLHLPPEFLLPIQNFLSLIETEKIKLPLPRMILSEEDLKILLDIVSSNTFSDYSLQHSQLDSGEIPPKTALRHIRKIGREILQKNLDLLRLKQTTVSLLPVTAKVVDVVFGKLPGTLAEYSAKLAQGFLNERRRIVVYDASPIFDLVVGHLRPLIEKPKG